MATEAHIYDGASWRKARYFYIHDGTAWRDCQSVYMRDASAWRLVFQKNLWVSISSAYGVRMFEYSGEIYVSGPDGVYKISSGVVSDIGDFVTDVGGPPNGVVVVGGTVYATRQDVTPAGGLYKFDGTNWIQDKARSYAIHLTTDGTDVYYAAGFPTNTVYKWDGTTETSLGSPLGINTIRYLSGTLYACTSSGLKSHSGGTTWSSAIGGKTTNCKEAHIFSSTLHVGYLDGLFSWDGATMTEIGALGDTRAITTFGSDLVAGQWTSPGSYLFPAGSAPATLMPICNFPNAYAVAGGVLYACNSAGIFKWTP